ncbi:hypothetical protein HKI87_03g18670 [Chloropicon roscoffensis]|uniref:Uncharacterized protein n=2 Tax=Chloropicon roscoffensis TaxID=1461544 RepID=A0AAX4P2I3_9CHLO
MAMPGGGKTRITFSRAFLESSGLASGLAGRNEGPLTLTIDESKLDALGRDPCVITLRGRKHVGRARAKAGESSTRQQQKLPGVRESRGEEDQGVAASRLADAALVEAGTSLRGLGPPLATAIDARSRESVGLGEVFRDLSGLSDRVDSLVRDVARARAAREEAGARRETRAEGVDVGTQTAAAAAEEEEEEEEEEIGGAEDGAVAMAASLFFERCVTAAARRALPEQAPTGLAEEGVIRGLSAQFFARVAAEAACQCVLRREPQNGAPVPEPEMEEEGQEEEDDEEEEEMVEDEPRPAPSPPAREEEDEEEEMPAPPREIEERPSEAGEDPSATAELAPSLAPPRAAGLRSREELALELEWTLRALDQRMAFLESQRARAAG